MGRSTGWRLVPVLLALACQTVIEEVPPDPPDPVHAALVAQDPLPVGDPDCPFGGVRLRVGTDDGAGGGIADDGVLQEGETRSSHVLCSGPEPEPEPEPESPYLSTAPPDGPPGTLRIVNAGGQGVTDDGGKAGPIQLTMSQAARRGHIAVFATGQADTDFPDPPRPVVDLGPTPWEVTSDAVLEVAPDPSALPVGACYLSTSDSLVRRRTAGDPEIVTGIRVHEGVTLEVGINTLDAASLLLSDALVIDGTLRIAERTRDVRGNAVFNVPVLSTGPASVLDLSGQDAAGDAPGQAAGSLQIVARRSPPDVPVTYGVMHLLGTLDLSGGGGMSGGRAGNLTLTTQNQLTTRGLLDLRGGEATDGAAGVGGTLTVRVDGGPWFHRATIDTTGGTGRSRAATGGPVDGRATGLWWHADVLQDGGDLTACTEACDGGAAGDLTLTASAGPILWAGTLRARGGDGAANGTTRLGDGGDGGRVVLQSRLAPDARQPAGGRSITLSVDIDTTGGVGPDDGGEGGSLQATVLDALDADATIRLLGYEAIVLDGGDGAAEGGDGERLLLSHANTLTETSHGGVVLGTPLFAVGGTGDIGGDGGTLELVSRGGVSPDAPERHAVLLADIDVSGGQGVTRGGASGRLLANADWGLDLFGDVIAVGGDATGPTSQGGDAGLARLQDLGLSVRVSQGTVLMEGLVDLRGGQGQRVGGRGATVTIEGYRLDLAGTLDLQGGYSPLGDGGDGGDCFAVSSFADVTLDTAILRVGGGEGDDERGADGRIVIDGIDRTEELNQ